MKLFESAFKKKWEWYERYYDTNLKESVVRQIHTKPEYYTENQHGDYNLLLDNNIRLKKQYGRSKNDEKIYSPTPSNICHIRDNYWGKDKSTYNMSPNIWFIDIETTALSNIDVINTPEEVVLMQIYDTSTKHMIVLGSRSWNAYDQYKSNYYFKCTYINCTDEIGIFNAYFKLLHKLKPLLVLGWNTEGFDYPYMFNRSEKLGFDTNKFSPFGTASLNKNILTTGKIIYKLQADGIHYLDYMDLYKKYSATQSSYSLDNISKVELGRGKVGHSFYKTFDGFRTGMDYIFPDNPPTDAYDLKMYNLQIQYKDTRTNELREEIHDLANDLFVHYGVIDTYILKEIDDVKLMTMILLNISSKMGCLVSEAIGTVKPWSSYINNIAHLSKLVLPSDEVDENADTSIKGGYVAEPVRGKHRWVVSIDISSAYPLLSIESFNMSAETYISPMNLPQDLRDMNLKHFNNEDEEERFRLYLEEPDTFAKYTDLLKQYNLSAGVNGAIFKRDSKGIIPTLINGIFKERKYHKKLMLDWEQKADDLKAQGKDYSEAQFGAKTEFVEQFFRKILINSLYGAQANKFFKLFNINVARAVTANTRFYIHLLNHRINEKLQSIIPKETTYTVYNDTDSGYFSIAPFIDKYSKETGISDVQVLADYADKFIQEIIDPTINNLSLEFADILNAYQTETINSDREAISDVSVFLNKKKYFMRVIDNEGIRYAVPKLKTMGIEIARSSTPVFIKEKLKESIHIILDSTESELKEWVLQTKKQFTTLPLIDIAKSTSIGSLQYNLNKPTFKAGKKVTIPINSRAALATNEVINTIPEYKQRYSTVSAGDKVKLLYLKEPNIFGQNIFAFTANEFAENYRELVDYDTNWNKYFMKSLDIMITAMDWDMNRTTEEISVW